MKQKLLFVGDLFYDYDFVADDIVSLSKWIKMNNYLTIANLEGGILCQNGKKIKKRGPNLSSSMSVIEVFKLLNVVGVCLANNHIMDFSEEGLDYTIQVLEKNGIKHTGAGKTLSDALAPMRISVNGKDILIFNYGWEIEETVYATDDSAGCAPRKEEVIIGNMQKAEDSLKIACLHWGFEYNRLPMPIDIQLAHRLVENGCDLVIGHHPHCVQPVENYKGISIYYSLGNFYFAGRRSRYKKVFNETIKNQSDYGVMVSYDVDQNIADSFMVAYDHGSNRSDIVPVNQDVLEVLKPDSVKSVDYMRAVKQRKLNINPILTGGKTDGLKLGLLFFYYRAKATLKAILRK